MKSKTIKIILILSALWAMIAGGTWACYHAYGDMKQIEFERSLDVIEGGQK